MAGLRAAGTEVWVTVTDPDEARIARDAGADALVLQGVEAGGHRGTFVDRPGSEGLGLLALLRLVAAADLRPAARRRRRHRRRRRGGGGAGGRRRGGAARHRVPARARGGHAPEHRRAIAGDAPTALTRAFTGRLARGIVNGFMTAHPDAPVGYPEIHHATAPLRAAARERGDADGFNLWAGEAHALARELPAAEIVRTLSDEAERRLG